MTGWVCFQNQDLSIFRISSHPKRRWSQNMDYPTKSVFVNDASHQIKNRSQRLNFNTPRAQLSKRFILTMKIFVMRVVSPKKNLWLTGMPGTLNCANCATDTAAATDHTIVLCLVRVAKIVSLQPTCWNINTACTHWQSHGRRMFTPNGVGETFNAGFMQVLIIIYAHRMVAYIDFWLDSPLKIFFIRFRLSFLDKNLWRPKWLCYIKYL